MIKDETFEEIMNEKVSSYLREIKKEFNLYEIELIHCINEVCTKHIDVNIHVLF